MVIFAPLVFLALAAALCGGLLRAGIGLPLAAESSWLPMAAADHAALMICGFMGTVIAIERAVALKRTFGWIAPLLSGAGAVAFLAGQQLAGEWLLFAGSFVFVMVNLEVLRRQQEEHTVLLLASAVCLAIGNALFVFGVSRHGVLPWWFAFLVVTIAAERLEMTRLMPRRPAASAALQTVLALLVAGCVGSMVSAVFGSMLFGLALLLLAVWLLLFDIARRTVMAGGLSRYMAIALLGGYVWLGIAGIAWSATAVRWPTWDAALHALGLGFIFSMMMAHAPVILPAVAKVKVAFSRWLYAPLALLHMSLAVRLFFGWSELGARQLGVILNVVAIVLFAATLLLCIRRVAPRRLAVTAGHPS